MSFLKAQQFLHTVAHYYKDDQLAFSKEEINKKINEIKYLATQKKVPKLTLRKEILHLEHQLQNISELEKQLLKRKKEESTKVAALKRQITTLKKQLSASNNKDLNKRINKLSHLLADYLAKKDSKDNTELNQKVLAEMKTTKSKEERLKEIEERLEEIKAKLSPDSPQAQVLQEKIYLLEQKLEAHQKKPILKFNPEDRHIMIHTPPPQKREISLEKLPLPPAPRS
ncbi:MAG: hypothetical protein KKH52_02920 [Nanoarchaeota archaeon]|nr:hypothetical protein [Nanoarchaeota archaeon]MBU1622817.1 hypothetical protein [Nanoarchaeota archaeon]MBU1974322.1 hypothetical protein [Nanoarchaeota archaeon]